MLEMLKFSILGYRMFLIIVLYASIIMREDEQVH